MLLPLLKGHWILGYGYFSGLLSLSQSLGETSINSHSGYMDVLVSLGLVGLSVAIGFLLWLGTRSMRLLLLGPSYLRPFEGLSNLRVRLFSPAQFRRKHPSKR